MALESKCVHCAQVCRSDWQRAHWPAGLQAAATVSSAPHRTHFTTSRKPGVLKVFGEIGGCPRGVYSFFGSGFLSVYPGWWFVRGRMRGGGFVHLLARGLAGAAPPLSFRERPGGRCR